MSSISHIDFFEKGSYDLNFWIYEEDASFEVYLGKSSEEASSLGELEETGISFSGVNGYLFDQSGAFFGGYSPEVEFNLNLIKKDYESFSYYFNGSLISNNRNIETLGLNAIKFSKHQNSRLNGSSFSEEFDTIDAGTFGEFVEDNLDNLLYSSDNILLISNL